MNNQPIKEKIEKEIGLMEFGFKVFGISLIFQVACILAFIFYVGAYTNNVLLAILSGICCISLFIYITKEIFIIKQKLKGGQMKTQKEIEKGCGKYDEDNPELCRSCGDILFNNTIWYCPTCKALLQQTTDFIEVIEKFKKNTFGDKYQIIKESDLQSGLIEFSYTGELYPIERLEGNFEELKSKIIGSEEK